jgi:DNA-binding NarL/FixJ family response regulator
MTRPVRVLVVDDQDLVRWRTGRHPFIEIVGEAADGPAAVAAAVATKPDVVLMDIEIPCGDGLTATRDVLTQCPNTKVLMLTTSTCSGPSPATGPTTRSVPSCT